MIALRAAGLTSTAWMPGVTPRTWSADLGGSPSKRSRSRPGIAWATRARRPGSGIISSCHLGDVTRGSGYRRSAACRQGIVGSPVVGGLTGRTLAGPAGPVVASRPSERGGGAVGQLDGQVAIVTGAGTGIGRSTALALAKEGAAVVVAARTVGDLESLAQEIEAAGGKALAVPTDVSVEEQAEALVKRTLDTFG